MKQLQALLQPASEFMQVSHLWLTRSADLGHRCRHVSTDAMRCGGTAGCFGTRPHRKLSWAVTMQGHGPCRGPELGFRVCPSLAQLALFLTAATLHTADNPNVHRALQAFSFQCGGMQPGPALLVTAGPTLQSRPPASPCRIDLPGCINFLCCCR